MKESIRRVHYKTREEVAGRLLLWAFVAAVTIAVPCLARAEVDKTLGPGCAAQWGDHTTLVAICEDNQERARARLQRRVEPPITDGEDSARDYGVWSSKLAPSPVTRACLEEGLAKTPPGAEPNWTTIEDCVLQEDRPLRPAQADAWGAIPFEAIRSVCDSLEVIRSFDHCFKRLAANALQSATRAIIALEIGAAETIFLALDDCRLAQVISDSSESEARESWGFDGISLRILKERAAEKADQQVADQCVREAAILVRERLHEPIFEVCYLIQTDPHLGWLSGRSYREKDASIVASCTGDDDLVNERCVRRRVAAHERECRWLERSGQGEPPAPDDVLALNVCKRISEEISYDLRIPRLDAHGFSDCLNETLLRRGQQGP